MSESSKMGLFGSKDDNTGAGSNDDGKTEPTKPKENSPERYNAPYSIDSDSETYDTEALSMMDINDIIGVQAESAGDSTLESEFAALSEVITDCKGEFSSKIGGAVDGKDETVDTCRDGQADDKKLNDSAGIASMSKSLQLIGEAYISEDSQETDTDDTPERIPPKAVVFNECLQGSKSNAEGTIEEKISCDKAVRRSIEQTAAMEENVIVPCTSVLKEDCVVKEIEEGRQTISQVAPKSPRIKISVDTTDCANADNSTDKPDEEDKTENMDVDRSSPENIVEKAVAESQSNSKIEIEGIKKNPVFDKPQMDSVMTKTEEPMEVDQASDKISAKVETASVDFANPEGAIGKPEETSDSLGPEASKIPSESDTVRSVDSNKCIDEISADLLTRPQHEDIEESGTAIKRDESLAVSKFVDEEPASSFEVSKNDEIGTEKFDTEIVDTLNEKPVSQNVISSNAATEIGVSSSGIENVVAEASPEKQEEEEEPEKRPDNPRKIDSEVEKEPSSLVREAVESEPMEVDDNLTNIQPESRIDDPLVAVSNLSINCIDVGASVSDVSSKECTAESAAAEPESTQDAASVAGSVQDQSSLDTTSIDRDVDESAVTASPEKSSTSADADEPESKVAAIPKEKANEESIASPSDSSGKSPTAMLQVQSTPEVGTMETANKESLSTAAESPGKFQTETAQVDSMPEVGSMETENEESFGIAIETYEQSPGETVQVHATPEVGSKESAIEHWLAPADESSDKSSAIVESSRVESTADAASNEFTVRASTEFSAEDEKMEVDSGKIGKREEEENGACEPETASQQAEESPATIQPEVCTAREVESTVSKAVESDVQETVDDSSVASPEVSETDKIVEERIEVPVEATITIVRENDSTETRAVDAMDQIPHDDENDNEKDSNTEKKSPIVKETAESIENSGEVDPAEIFDEAAKENDEDESKPEVQEEQTPEASIVIEAKKTSVDGVADARNEETEAMEESSIATKMAVCESVSTEEAIQDEIPARSAVEEKSAEDPTIDAESNVALAKSKISSDAVSSIVAINPNDTDEDPVEEMNLSLDPEISESHDEAQPVDRSLPSEEIATDPEEEIEDHVEMNLTLEPEEKTDESRNFDTDVANKTIVKDRGEESSITSTTDKPEGRQAETNLHAESEEQITHLPRILIEEAEKTTVEDCMEESSMTSTADKVEESEERNEKSCEDIDEYSKDVEPTSLSVPEMFHDEQSQTTQEMMESILETDTGNLNKILDAEEAEGEALARSNALPLEPEEIDELSDKLPSESDELLNKELDDPMSSQNIDSLEGLLDLDLIPENDESALKVVEPIVEKVMGVTEEDIGTDYMLDVAEQAIDYSGEVPKAVEDIAAAKEIDEAVDIVAKSVLDVTNESLIIPPIRQLASAATELIDNDIDAAFALSSVVPDPLETVPLVSEETKIDLAEDLLREIAVEEERKMKLAEQLFLGGAVTEETKIDLLLQTAVQGPSKIDLADEVETDRDVVLRDPALLRGAVEAQKSVVLADPILLQAVVPEDSKIELSEDIDLESAVQDQVLTDVATEIEDFAPTSEISELESAVKFLQESVEQDIDSPLVLSPKLVDSVVEDIAQESDVGIFVGEPDICDDPSELVAELENIIPDPIAISEAEIITEAAKLESERKTKEEAEVQSPIVIVRSQNEIDTNIRSPIFNALEKQHVELSVITSPLPVAQEPTTNITPRPGSPKNLAEPRESTIVEKPVADKMEHESILKKSAPIPKMSILEERLKVPPKIEIPIGEVSRICETPTTTKTSLLIQRDAKLASYQKMLESPKTSEKTELKIVETPRKESDKHDFENVGSPRIILKIAKSAIADCGEPRSPKSPKIRSATNSPNPDDSPGQKLGKIKLKLSKGGHPSIIPNDNVEEVCCGQWHTEGTSSLSPLGMKIKFSKIGDASIVQTEKHETAEETKEQPKHKFEESKRTESPIGMKIKLSRTGDPSIVQQDAKESSSKHKDKTDMMQGSPKRTESPIGMKIKLSKSGDASIIQPDKQESSDESREASTRSKDKLDVPQDTPRRTESPLGMKIKLFKTGDASIVQPDNVEDNPQDAKRTDSPLGMKIKLSKTRVGTSIVPIDDAEDARDKLEVTDATRRTDSPLGMKIKLSRSGDASIIHSEEPKESSRNKERTEACHDSTTEASLGVKIKVTKSIEAGVIQSETTGEPEVRMSPIGMKIKLSKTGDPSIVHSDSQEQSDESRVKERIEKIDSSIGMRIKLSKTGDASIIHNQKKSDESTSADVSDTEHKKLVDVALGVKIKLAKSSDASVVETEKKEKSSRRKDTEMPLEMKIKLSKTGHPTIVACENYGELSQRSKDNVAEASAHGHAYKHKETSSVKENPGIKIMKSMHAANLHCGRSELTIEPIQLQNKKNETAIETSSKRKDVTISPIESKKAKLEAKLSQMLPEVTIQPIKPRDPKKMMFDAKASSISRQQMNVISQEISITQVRPNKPMDLSMTDKLKSMLAKNVNSSVNSDCEIIERHPELIIVNENSNSSQDVMIIEEVPALRGPDAKIPKKRGRPRRNPMPLHLAKPLPESLMPAGPVLLRDPLALDDVTHVVAESATQNLTPKENERPKRTCSRQKSYAPPRRGRRRGGGRGKRKMEMSMDLVKKPRIEQDLDLIERSTTALITIDETPSQPPDVSHNTSELYKALRQPPMDSKMVTAMARVEAEQTVNDANLMAKSRIESLMDSRLMSHLGGVMETTMKTSTPVQSFSSDRKISLVSLCGSEGQVDMATEHMDKTGLLAVDEKLMDKVVDDTKDSKDVSTATDHQNWLTPSSKRQLDGRNEGNMSNVQVIDEETRMSAESVSRSQTPARNMSVQAPETIINEESQGSVLSTATTESEKVKVKNRRMEINFDPDEGPFTVDKIAEYEWPPDPSRKSETFMIQEQISQYLGVKSFKRKYPDLKRRMVDMEERNFLRENALVSESMCDMGLTAVSSSEVLDVMCNDFPEQYEEYRKYIREKQMKEHSKKQKELTAAANAERNRIDLAEMAVQSALSWNVGLNKARRESRKCSLDLQTFTIHVPKKQQKVEEESKVSHYPVALIPGQYTDYYREYTPAELRYYPLNTVLYGPMKPNERKFDSQSEGSQSDSDSDSSSDDSSSSSSDGTQDTEESQSTMDEVDVELSRQKEDIKSIKCKMCLKHLNKFSRIEVLIQCGTCSGYVHPSCIDLTLDMVPHIQAYAWQCTDCKTCAQCHDPADEDKMLFCDMCDRGYHIYCVGLRRVPQGRWHCQECAVCASCGSREAGGANSDRNSVAQWQHEYKKGDKNTRVYVSTLCVPCSKLWRKGRYCPHCSRCHTVPRLDLEANLVHCSACDKYLHLGCVETKDLTIDRKNYLCDFCQPSRQQMVKPLVSKVFRT